MSDQVIENEEVKTYAEPGEELKPGQTRVQVVDLTAQKDQKRIKNTHSFHFEHHSAADKKVFSGTVTVKRLNIGEMARAETDLARRNAGIPSTEAIAFFNERLVFLKSRIVSGPDWAVNLEGSDDLHDPVVVQRLWEEVQKYEDSFR